MHTEGAHSRACCREVSPNIVCAGIIVGRQSTGGPDRCARREPLRQSSTSTIGISPGGGPTASVRSHRPRGRLVKSRLHCSTADDTPAQPVRSEAGGPRRNEAPRVSPQVDGLGTTEPPEPPTPPATSSTKYISHAASRLARPAATAPATAMTPAAPAATAATIIGPRSPPGAARRPRVAARPAATTTPRAAAARLPPADPARPGQTM